MSIIHEALNKVEREKENVPSGVAEPEVLPPHKEKWKFPVFFGEKNLLGVDIGSSTVKFVRLEGGPQGYLLAGAGLERILSESGEQEGSAALGRLVKRERLEGALTSSVFDSQTLVVSQIKLPRMPKSDLKEAVRWEVKKDMAFNEEAVVDYVINGEIELDGKRQLSIMAFAASKEEVMAHIELIKGASLKPYALDIVPMALLSAFDYNYGWEHGKRYAVVDIGASRTTLAIFFDGKLRLSRRLPIAGNDITLAIKEARGVDFETAEELKLHYMNDDEEPFQSFGDSGQSLEEHFESFAIFFQSFSDDMAREIERSLIYYTAQFREGSVDNVLICGGGAGMEGLVGHVEKILGLPVALYDAMKGIRLKGGFPDGSALSPAFVRTLGLALRRKGQ